MSDFYAQTVVWNARASSNRFATIIYYRLVTTR